MVVLCLSYNYSKVETSLSVHKYNDVSNFEGYINKMLVEI